MTLTENILKLFEIVNDLRKNFPNKEFTLDGRLVGDIGEILVQENYDVHLYSTLEKTYDGYDSYNRKVQIKATFKDKLSFPCNKSEVPDYYIGIKINSDGSFEEIYNGKGSYIWELVKSRQKTKTSSFQISVSSLKKLNDSVDVFDKIEEKNNKMSEDSIGSSMYTIGERKNNKYLKEIDISILTDSIMEKYSKQLDYCNLDKEALEGNYYDRKGWVYYGEGPFHCFDLQIKELVKN